MTEDDRFYLTSIERCIAIIKALRSALREHMEWSDQERLHAQWREDNEEV